MFRAVRSLSILVRRLALLVGGVGLLTPALVLAQGGASMATSVDSGRVPMWN